MDPKEKNDENNPFYGIEMSTVLQDCRCFNDRDVDVRRCCEIISQFLYLHGVGHHITKESATTVFFGATKLLQSKDENLKRLVFLMLREMSSLVSPEERIILTAALVNGMKDSSESVRSNSIRVLGHIIDPSMFGGEIERKVKESVVDKNDAVSSSALVLGIRLSARQSAFENIKKWVSEIGTTIQNGSPQVQLQAVSLLWTIRKYDRLGVTKMVGQLLRVPLRSPFAQCLRLRLVGKIMEEDQRDDRTMYLFVESCLRHNEDAIKLEAARIICSVSSLSPSDINPAVDTIKKLLLSHSIVTQFSALRVLNQLATNRPSIVSPLNLVLEPYMSASNRSLATLTIATLLKTASDWNIDNLMKKISSFMTEIADEFKTVVIKAMRTLCLKFPHKHLLFISFLGSVIREEGGFQYKKMIVDSICDIIGSIPECAESAFEYLCLFIEDCEFPSLSVKIIHLLGTKANEVTRTYHIIRTFYNRLLLDEPSVRAAAIDALAQIGKVNEKYRAEIISLLKTYSTDSYDEVRDRAILNLELINHSELSTSLMKPLNIDFADLENSLIKYCNSESSDESKSNNNNNIVPFDLNSAETEILKLMEKRKLENERLKKISGAKAQVGQDKLLSNNTNDGGSLSSSPSSNNNNNSNLISGSGGGGKKLVLSLPEVSMCGKLLKTSKRYELTESDSDYVVTCEKHIFESHIVLQFDVTNTVDSCVLENVFVECDLDAVEGVELVKNVPIQSILPNATASSFVILKQKYPNGSIVNTLKFLIKEIDPETGEVSGNDSSHHDEYQLEDLRLKPSDLVLPTPITEFRNVWESLAAKGCAEKKQVFSLSKNTIPAAQAAVLEFLELGPCEGTHRIQDGDKAKKHSLLAAGAYVKNVPVLCIVNFSPDETNQIIHIRVILRSPSEEVCNALMLCVG